SALHLLSSEADRDGARRRSCPRRPNLLRRLAGAGGHCAPSHVGRRSQRRRSQAPSQQHSTRSSEREITPMISFSSFVISDSSVSMLMLLVKATLILLVALGVTLSMQRASAGSRHLVWLVTLSTLLLVPALTAWAPIRLRILPATASNAPSPAPSFSGNAPKPKTDAAKFDKSPVANPIATAAELNAPAASLEQKIANSPILSGLSIAVLLWAVVVLAIAVSLGYAAMMVKRIVNRARPLDSEDWLAPLWEVSDRLSLEEPPRLLRSEDAKMPFACGVFTPTIVLPAECDTWSLDRRRAVL